MIILKRKEEIRKYQLELVVRVKTKQSPFIAILILAKEEGLISAEILQKTLLPVLPLRACGNLLERLYKLKYLIENSELNIREFRLTEFGEHCAEDKSFWSEEKGLYDIYISDSTLISQQLIYLR